MIRKEKIATLIKNGFETCAAGVWEGDTCQPGPSADEICDGRDNDCDDEVDEDLTRVTTCGVGECERSGIETCTAGLWGDDTCQPGQPADEICDGLDNNCDGIADEYDPDCTLAPVADAGCG